MAPGIHRGHGNTHAIGHIGIGDDCLDVLILLDLGRRGLIHVVAAATNAGQDQQGTNAGESCSWRAPYGSLGPIAQLRAPAHAHSHGAISRPGRLPAMP